jgi:hypothetical protein
MPLSMPTTIKSQGNSLLIVLPTPPVSLTAPTKAELNAGKFITCHIYGSWSITPSQNTGEAPRKACSTIVGQQLGNVTYPPIEIQYSYVPQALGTPGSAGNEAFEALVPGSVVFLAEGVGLDGKTSALSTGALVNLLKQVTCGVQRRGMTGDGEFDEFSVTQSLVLADGTEPKFDYAVPSS